MDTEQPQWTAGSDERTEPGFVAGQTAREPDADAGPSRMQRIGVAIFAFLAFLFFLVMKLPEARIQNLVIAHIRILAQEQGFGFTAEKMRLGLVLGPSVRFENVELRSLDDERQSLKIPYLKIRPRLLSLLSSIKKVGFSADLLDGHVSGFVGASTAGAVSMSVSLDSIDVGATALTRRFLGVDVSGHIDGDIDLDIDPQQTQKSEGRIKLRLTKVALPAQSLSGFNLPKLGVSQANVNIAVDNGKFEVREFEVGKDPKTDDIVGKLTGEGTINRYLDRSTVNAKAVFFLSQTVKQISPLLMGILKAAETPDGKYAYRLTGTLSALEPIPGQ